MSIQLHDETMHTLSVRGIEIDVVIEWEGERLDCTSEVGNQTVTERWTEWTAVAAEWNGHRYELDDTPTTAFELAVAAAVTTGAITHE